MAPNERSGGLVEVSSFDISEIFWRRLVARYADEFSLEHLKVCLAKRELLRKQMDFNTGSITMPNAVALWHLCRHLKPTSIFEVGTFIGKSTTSMLLGHPSAKVVSCDISNDAAGTFPEEQVKLYPHTSSTDALRDQSAMFDLFYIDGRLQGADVAHMERLSHTHTLVALDDFEGIEKGVANATRLRQEDPWDKHLLLPPIQGIFDVPGRFNIALIVPTWLVSITRQ